ncbi:MAG: hypothetical protein ACC618_01860 [Patescibacteria group bacterium]
MGKEKLKETEIIFKRKQEELNNRSEEIRDLEKELRWKELALSEEAKTEMEENIRRKLLELK